EQEVDNADGIIGDLLEMTRAKAPVKAPVDLGEVVTAAFSRLQSERLSLDLAIDPQPFRVDADAGQLRQVFTNLLLNAAQAMDGRGTVRVRARHFGGQALVTVEDEGAGIRPEDRERVFEPLFTTKAKGTGLGLPVCRQIIEGHGGTIAVADTSSAGTRFEIRLPEVPEDHWGGTEQRR
ncbi:MAG TPA: ATP-binding protein, partial [Candidatus Polarisedimenticolaceae bacterium]|nr:ATP-binding protein [Candidatus Polarisedimenticolaceae bacterium]